MKGLADLKLNNELDELIDERVERDGIVREEELIWECESCPDLAHGKEQWGAHDEDELNLSFPGLNQKVDAR